MDRERHENPKLSSGEMFANQTILQTAISDDGMIAAMSDGN